MDSIIKEKIVIGELDKNINYLNVAYGVDENFLFGAGISICSLLLNNNNFFKFHLVTDYIDNQFMECLKKINEKYKSQIIVYLLEPNELKKLPTSAVWSYATYFRFFIFDFLCEQEKSVLYLDADIVCKGSLLNLLKIKFENEYAAVILDVDEMQKNCESRLDIYGYKGKYFNAGVIFLNLQMWKKEIFTKKAFEMIQERKLKYLDQDALNILFDRNNIYLDRDYNCIYTLKNELKKINYQDYIKKSTILIHYTGATKPWHYWGIDYPASKPFKDAFENSPWKELPLKGAQKKVEYQERYKHEFRQKKIIKGLISLVKYKYFK